MPNAPTPILRVAVPCPLAGCFDYLPPDCPMTAAPGQRVLVPFGRRETVGVIVEVGDGSSLPRSRLKRALAVLDVRPLFTDDLRALMHWTANYYHHPIGEVYATALPVALRQARHTDACGQWQSASAAPEKTANQDGRAALTPQPGPTLSSEQIDVLAAIVPALEHFHCLLLDGVTGSGKTEVYLQAIQQVITRGGQALVLVPEIGLTPQLIARFRERVSARIGVLHSALADGERAETWLAAGRGDCDLLIGTRSAIFTPLPRLRLIVVDEEHDTSLKQQDGLRYHARDLAVVRARNAGIPILLGSATPSLESLHNADRGRYQRLCLNHRAAGASAPDIQLLDLRGRRLRAGLSEALIEAMRRHLADGAQVLLFLNRRGYAPVLLCHDCGWLANCRGCDARLTWHRGIGRMVCHHCGQQRQRPSVCVSCGGTDLRDIGQGTERIEEALAGLFPEHPVARIDRDTTRRKGAMQRLLSAALSGEARILLGTQMLAKGHHLPEVSLVGMVDCDQGLFSIDFRASERLAQLITQVAGRAGRASRKGEVLLQTHHPGHPLLLRLIEEGYRGFARACLAERAEAQWPPWGHLALLRAEAGDQTLPGEFLNAAKALAIKTAPPGVGILGPVPAPMMKRAGRYRAQLLLQAERREPLQRCLSNLIPALQGDRSARRVRWSIDVDPQDML
jgi:primosomal protein N' (replication factor Y) (superfamily II helicase)